MGQASSRGFHLEACFKMRLGGKEVSSQWMLTENNSMQIQMKICFPLVTFYFKDVLNDRFEVHSVPQWYPHTHRCSVTLSAVLRLKNSELWSAFLLWAPMVDDPPVNGVSGNLTQWLCAPEGAVSVGVAVPCWPSPVVVWAVGVGRWWRTAGGKRHHRT